MQQSIHDVVEEFNEKLGNIIEDLPRVRANKIGLDSRAGSVFVDVENGLIIAKNHNVRSLEYYGGMEYCDEEYRTVAGDYVIYSAEDSRVQSCLDFFSNREQEN